MKFFNKKACTLVAMVGFTLGSYGCGAEVATQDYEVTTEQNEVTTEQEVIDYVNNLYNDLNAFLQTEEVEQFNYEINHILAEMTGFIFYDDPILGYSLKDISDAGKQEIGEIWAKTVTLMEDKYPEFTANVSEGLTEAQKKGLELYNSGSAVLSGALKEVIGEENYNAIWDTAEELVETGKTKVYEWYQNYNEND